jgi:hypothetical protein
MSTLYRVVWKCVETGIESHGDYVSMEAAKEWADYGNRKWGTDWWARRQEWRQVLNEEDDGLIIQHWVESYPVVELKNPPVFIRQTSLAK